MQPTSDGDEHMFVIVAEANAGKEHQTHLLVNFSSIKDGIYHDPACTVVGNRKHHSFLRRDSFVAYEHAEIQLASDLVRGVGSRRLTLLDPASPDLLERIKKGIAKSARIARKHRSYFEKNG